MRPRYDHADAVGHVPDDGEVMTDEQVGEAEFVLQIAHQIENCACTETSSAEVGSSHTMNSASDASARAIAMRCR